MSRNPIKAFNEDELIAYLKRRLGGALLGVELTEDNYTDAISDAFKAISAVAPRWCRTTLSVNSDIKQYELPYVGRGVVEVEPSKYTSYIGYSGPITFNLGDGVVSSVLTYNRDTFGIDQVYEQMVYGEMAGRVFSGDFQWEVEDGYLYITNLPKDVSQVSLIYVDNHDYESLHIGHEDWVRRFALAQCKQTLGRHRGKFGTPGPASQAFLQDALNLNDEGKQEEAELRVELAGLARPLPPTWGA